MKDDEIRLLVIQPPELTKLFSEPSIASCRLNIVSLNDSPTFEALSYRYGQPTHGPDIHLDGSTFEVRKNLGDALCHLRHKMRPRVIWIDALCINQDDDFEKAVQIQLMGRIYSTATQVVVWLGLDGRGEDRRAFDLTVSESLRQLKVRNSKFLRYKLMSSKCLLYKITRSRIASNLSI